MVPVRTNGGVTETSSYSLDADPSPSGLCNKEPYQPSGTNTGGVHNDHPQEAHFRKRPDDRPRRPRKPGATGRSRMNAPPAVRHDYRDDRTAQ